MLNKINQIHKARTVFDSIQIQFNNRLGMAVTPISGDQKSCEGVSEGWEMIRFLI